MFFISTSIASLLKLPLLSILFKMRFVFSHEVSGGYEHHAPATGDLTLAGGEAAVSHLHCNNMHSFLLNVFLVVKTHHFC